MRFVLSVALMLGAFAAAPGRAQDPVGDGSNGFFTLASGDVGGNYFAIARAVCREVNRIAGPALRCSPEVTPGSVYNLAGLQSRELDFAIVQSDWLAAAREASGRFAPGQPFGDLRGVSELYHEAITVIVGPQSGILDPGDMTGKRIDIGQPASGRRSTIERIFEALGIGRSSLPLVTELPTAAAVDELCAGRLDAVILVVGHPDANVARAVEDCDARILPLAGTAFGDGISALGDYLPERIEAGLYPSVTEPIDTYGMTAALVTRSDVADDQVAAMREVLASRENALVRAAPALGKRGTQPRWTGLGGVAAHAAVTPTE